MSQSSAVDVILAVLPLDETGHVTDCGFDEAETCGCFSLPTRLAAIVSDHVAAAVTEARVAALNEAAEAIEAEAGLQERCAQAAFEDLDDREGECYEQGETVARRCQDLVRNLATTPQALSNT